jgi:hypothetical protein
LCLTVDVDKTNASYITNMSTVIDNSKAWSRLSHLDYFVRSFSKAEVLHQSNTHEIEIMAKSMRSSFKLSARKSLLNLSMCGIWVSPVTSQVYLFSSLWKAARVLEIYSSVYWVAHTHLDAVAFPLKTGEKCNDESVCTVLPICRIGADSPSESFGLVADYWYEVTMEMNRDRRNTFSLTH